jgi:hypothetical protein
MDGQNHQEYRNKIAGRDQEIEMIPKPEYIIRIENKFNQLIDQYGFLKKENEALSKHSRSKDEEISILQKKVKDLEMNLEKEKEKANVKKGLGKPEL